MDKLTFSEIEIQRLFGHEAAEDEDLARLREYYFKSATYDQIVTDLPLRILVGHKGIGKSALFQVAIAEQADREQLAILIKPDDIIGLGADTSDFLRTIRDWKTGLVGIIARKVLDSIGGSGVDFSSKLSNFGGKLGNFLKETLKDSSQLNFSPANRAVMETYLKTGRITVYVDDLDRGWQGRPEDVRRISALLNALRDLVNENAGLGFRISLRSDVYYLVRTSDESTDKIEGSVIWQSWTNHEILVLLVKRVATFFGQQVDEHRLAGRPQSELALSLEPIMEPYFSGQGHWENAPMYRVLMSLIRKRPRDLVKLCTLAARRSRASGVERIRTRDFESIFEEYSQGRVQDTVNEFRSELPDIERLLLNMRPSKKERTAKQGYVYQTDGLLRKIGTITEGGEFRFAAGKVASAKELAAFMYKINFLTARKEMPRGIVRKYFEENRYLSNEFREFGFSWEIHPAYRWALQPESIEAIYRNLELGVDEAEG